MKRRIAFLVFPDFQLLDAAGPISAFEIAERYAPGTYELRVVATEAGAVTSTSGASMNAVSLGRPASIDTLVVVGGEGTRPASKDARIVRFVAACAAGSSGVARVCPARTSSRQRVCWTDAPPPRIGRAARTLR